MSSNINKKYLYMIAYLLFIINIAPCLEATDQSLDTDPALLVKPE